MSEKDFEPVSKLYSESILDVIRKQHQKSLSEIVRRGLKIRSERGWAPFMPPLGYLNNQTTKTIVPDPETWGRVRILLETAATKKLSIPKLAKFAREELALKCKNGKPFNTESLRRMMANPFYAGHFRYGGVLYEGKHRAMITEEQFINLQEILANEIKEPEK